MSRMMELQHRFKRTLKPLVLRDERKPRQVKLGPGRGISLWLNRRYNLQIEFGLWETELNSIYRQHIHPGSLVYDVGAGDGFTSLMYAKLGAQVIAFEPDHDALELLDANLRLNPKLAERIQVVRDVYSPVAAVPSFIKIDVDGAEGEVVDLVPHAPVIVVETHAASLEARCKSILEDADYAIRIIPNAWWRRLYPEYRPIDLNRWLLATKGTFTHKV